ncbi:MAG: DUF1572 family protein [Saprospiraceae bacterium]|nr:DUF1572 family protein [Saprospiraceae bacterium]
MLKSTLVEMFDRELAKLAEEINLYPDEASVWALPGTILNSGGTLCLHLCGNLKHFIGATLGNTGYVRIRDVEFSARNIPRAGLQANIAETRQIVADTLSNLTEDDFWSDFPLEKHGRNVSTTYMLLHLLSHLNYHLGQVNYHRRGG